MNFAQGVEMRERLYVLIADSISQKARDIAEQALDAAIVKKAAEQAAETIEAPVDVARIGPKPTVYISGPMSGKPNENREAFYAAERDLRGQGFEVFNPARMDDEDPVPGLAYPWPGEDPSEALRKVVTRDSAAIAKADMIALLPGWEKSRGARAEAEIARWLGLGAVFGMARTDGTVSHWRWERGGGW